MCLALQFSFFLSFYHPHSFPSCFFTSLSPLPCPSPFPSPCPSPSPSPSPSPYPPLSLCSFSFYLTLPYPPANISCLIASFPLLSPLLPLPRYISFPFPLHLLSPLLTAFLPQLRLLVFPFIAPSYCLLPSPLLLLPPSLSCIALFPSHPSLFPSPTSPQFAHSFITGCAQTRVHTTVP